MSAPRGPGSISMRRSFWRGCRSVGSRTWVDAFERSDLPEWLRRGGCTVLAVLLSGCNVTLPRPKTNVIPASFEPAIVADAPPLDPVLLKRPVFEYRLGPGDVLDIELLADGNTQATSVVGPDGKIYFYLLPGIDVWGLTLPRARELIVQEMQKLVREQQAVSVSLRKAESQRIWILGRLNKPGIYPMAGPMTLLEALAAAGGPASGGALPSITATTVPNSQRATEDTADLSRAFIIRDGRMLPVDFNRLLHEGDMLQNVYLLPNDFIYLPTPTVGIVHVLGAVETPRALKYVNRLTLRQAFSQAGGPPRRSAHLSQVAIVRGSLAQPRIAIVNLTAILAGEASDIALEPQDIVYVPHMPYRDLARYVELILDTYARTVGVNESARAVDGRPPPRGATELPRRL